MSFFTALLLPNCGSQFSSCDDGDQPPRRIPEQRVELRIRLSIAEIRQMQRQRALVRVPSVEPADRRGCARVIGGEEGAPRLGEKWQISKIVSRCCDRNRHRIGRIGDLRDEAAVLAERSASRWRMPDGRLSRTSCRIRL